jgi:hypothetical protein
MSAETCKSIIKQGANKGKQCWRPILKDGYCGKHQTDLHLEQGKSEGLYKCTTYRCIEMISEGKYCEECISKKEERNKTLTLCKAKITQGPNKGTQCDKQSSTPEGYCQKHLLNVLVEKAKEEGKRICDDGKRACKNYTEDGKLKCEECLSKDRTKDRERHSEKREEGRCLGCGCEITKFTEGIRHSVQRCAICYEKLKEIEAKRERSRNYKEERKEHMLTHYQNFKRSSIRRNIEFNISIEEFTEIVQQNCYYCNHYKETEAIGIDRVNNSIGYVSTNIVPCCADCNILKNDLPLEKFIDLISKIYHHRIENTEFSNFELHQPRELNSYVQPKEILKFYKSGTLDQYIEKCISDGRSATFIEKMRDLSKLILTETDVRKFIKQALYAETVSKTLEDRQRVSKKEMFGYLKLKNIKACIDHYSKVYGNIPEFNEDISGLVISWSENEHENYHRFSQILIKYQNKRNK